MVASQTLAATISRDTASANAGSLSQQFTDAKREEVAQGFQAAQILATETSVFFARKAQQAALAKKEAETGYRLDNTGQPLLDDQGNPIPLSASEREQAALTASQLTADWGAGSPARLIATAMNGAAGANVTGSLTSLVQASAVNVLQGLAVHQVKQIADSLKDGDSATAQSETVRAALQAVVGCAGSAAGGSGDCASAAMGAAGSVVVNYLLTEFGAPEAKDANHNGVIDPDEKLTLSQQQARTDLVATVVAGIAAGAGVDVAAAVTAAQIETENNSISTSAASYGKGACTPDGTTCLSKEQFLAKPDVIALIEATGLTEEQVYACAIGDGSTCTPQISATYAAAQQQAVAAPTPEETAKASAAVAKLTALGMSEADIVALAAAPGGGLASQYAEELSAITNLSTRLLPGGYRGAAVVGLAAGVGAAVTYAKLNAPPSSSMTPASDGPVKPDIESLPVAEPTPASVGLPPMPPLHIPLVTPIPEPGDIAPPLVTPIAPQLPPLPGYGSTTPVNTGGVLANTSTDPSYDLGQSDGGPGVWAKNGPFGKPADQCYQCQVTGAPLGIEYKVNGVHFDGYDPATNTLIDAKNYLDWPIDKPFSNTAVLEAAQKQVEAAKGTDASIEWRVASPVKADLLRGLFKDNGNLPIRVVVELPKGH